MTLIDDWNALAPKLWSIRLNLLAAALSALAAGLAMFQTTNIHIIVLTILVNFGAIAARLIAQPKAYGQQDESQT